MSRAHEARGVHSQPGDSCPLGPTLDRGGGAADRDADLHPRACPAGAPRRHHESVFLLGRGHGRDGRMGCGAGHPPVDNVVAQVSLEHQAPALDDVEEGLLEGAAVTLKPAVEHLGVLTLGHFLVQLLVGIDLENTAAAHCRAAVGGGRPCPQLTSSSSPSSPGTPAAPQPSPCRKGTASGKAGWASEESARSSRGDRGHGNHRAP